MDLHPDGVLDIYEAYFGTPLPARADDASGDVKKEHREKLVRGVRLPLAAVGIRYNIATTDAEQDLPPGAKIRRKKRRERRPLSIPTLTTTMNIVMIATDTDQFFDQTRFSIMMISKTPMDLCRQCSPLLSTPPQIGQQNRRICARAHENALVTSVASECNNTMVLINTVGVGGMDSWIENENVTAVVLEVFNSGYSIADVLYGNVNPSKPPYTIGKSAGNYPIPSPWGTTSITSASTPTM
ncbi:uncharacterized protein PAC_19540 [Phialocephala subalpina]|uniref:beta-glucosidase n=1 Tax=Phialocephala subalpina TaxID=576137 RepID=A0A1L7XXB4_9HELO|nr:uncharacterized protein PAC_19540 [Phialocephala subalpina]